MLLAPNVIEGYFIDDEIGKRTLNRELAGRECPADLFLKKDKGIVFHGYARRNRQE
jgi:hypothetical protein